MPPHVIDLKPTTGRIDAHVDSVKHGGELVAGLSLVSERTMTLLRNDVVVYNMVLPPRSLYVLHSASRYELAHAVSAGPQRRISIIFRDEPMAPKWASNNSNKDGDKTM